MNIKEWLTEHKKELLIGAGIIFIYRLGFKHGYQTLYKEAAKATEVTIF